MSFDGFSHLSGLPRGLFIIALAIGAHLIVRLLRLIGERFAMLGTARPGLSKPRTVASLVISTMVFTIYFAAVGMVLAEFGVSITAYLASASVIGLAVGFGSQGIVQDVVTGLTVIFSDLFDIGDLVEISGQVGVVSEIGMRFTVLTTPLGTSVFIPNRTISNVINYPKGYIRCLVDVTLPQDPERAAEVEKAIEIAATAVYDQFPGIHRRPPGIEGRFTTRSGKAYVRYKFRIWPGRGGPIETSFKQEILGALRRIDPEYSEWMIAISYEVEQIAGKGALDRKPGPRGQE